jgi:hypothetical protein
VHGNADETELVFTGDGALRRVPPSDRGSRQLVAAQPPA